MGLRKTIMEYYTRDTRDSSIKGEMIEPLLSAIATIFGILHLINVSSFFIPYRVERTNKAENVICRCSQRYSEK